MKNFFKLMGFIAMVAVIGFSMAACGGDDGGGGGGSSWPSNLNGTKWQISGSTQTIEFKTDNTFYYGDTFPLASAAENGKITVSKWGDTITLCESYSISGDTLTLNGASTQIFGAVTTLTCTKDQSGNGGGGGATWPANLNGTKWQISGGTETIEFKTDNTFYNGGTFPLASASENGKITVSRWGDTVTLCESYSISGNTLTLNGASTNIFGKTTVTCSRILTDWPADLKGTKWQRNSGKITLDFNTDKTVTLDGEFDIGDSGLSSSKGTWTLVSVEGSTIMVLKNGVSDTTFCTSYSISGDTLTLVSGYSGFFLWGNTPFTRVQN